MSWQWLNKHFKVLVCGFDQYPADSKPASSSLEEIQRIMETRANAYEVEVDTGNHKVSLHSHPDNVIDVYVDGGIVHTVRNAFGKDSRKEDDGKLEALQIISKICCMASTAEDLIRELYNQCKKIPDEYLETAVSCLSSKASFCDIDGKGKCTGTPQICFLCSTLCRVGFKISAKVRSELAASLEGMGK